MPIRIIKRPGEVHWTAAGSFSAVSLAQYLINQINNGSIVPTGGLGGGPWSVPTLSNPGSGGSTLLNPIIIHSLSGKLLISINMDVTDPNWTDISGGLDSNKNQIADQMFLSPAGGLYLAGDYINRAYSFVARASAPGEAFAEIWNSLVAADYFSGTVSAGSMRTQMVYFNPTLPDEIIFVGACNLGGAVFKCTAGGAIVEIPALSSLYGGSDTQLLTYGNGKFFTGKSAGDVYTFLPTYSGLASLGSLGGGDHVRADQIGTTIQPIAAGDLRIGANNLATHVDTSGLALDLGADSALFKYKMAISDDGMQVLTRNGDTTVMSNDGGNTFLDTELPPLSNAVYAYAGGAGAESTWIAAGNDGLQYRIYANGAGGTGPWDDKTGDALTVDPLLSVNCLMALPSS